MTYSDKLKDPRWQARRAEVLNRDDYTCRDCGEKPDSLDVHHLHYRKGAQPWEYPLNFLMSLCRDCHENRQSIEDEAKERIALMFGKMSVWRVYEMGKVAARFAESSDGGRIQIQHIKEPKK